MSLHWRAGLLCATLALLARVCLPWPSALMADAEVYLPPDAQLRAPHDAQVDAMLVQPGQRVLPGQPLLRLRDRDLSGRREILAAQQARLAAEGEAGLPPDGDDRQQAELAHVRQQLAQLEAVQADLILRARYAGEFVRARPDDTDEHLVRRGQLLGQILPDAPAVVRVMLTAAQAQRVRGQLQDASVMLAEQPGVVLRARPSPKGLQQADMAPSEAKPAASDWPTASNPSRLAGAMPAQGHFVLDLLLDHPLPRAGGLARVRLTLAPQAPWRRWLQGGEQTVD